LVETVRRGRKEEFAAFNWSGEPPDPQDEQTFNRSKLNHCLKKEGRHQALLEYHKELISLRKSLPALRYLSKEKMDVTSFDEDRVFAVRRWNANDEVLAIFNFNDREVHGFRNIPAGHWRKRMDSSDVRWLGTGTVAPDAIDGAPKGGLRLQPESVLVYEKDIEEL